MSDKYDKRYTELYDFEEHVCFNVSEVDEGKIAIATYMSKISIVLGRGDQAINLHLSEKEFHNLLEKACEIPLKKQDRICHFCKQEKLTQNICLDCRIHQFDQLTNSTK